MTKQSIQENNSHSDYQAQPLTSSPPPTTQDISTAPHLAAQGHPSVFAAALKEVLQIVVPAILLALTIHIFLAQATVVYGQSMQPNLQPTERIVIEKVSYYFHSPLRNDIVVLDMPQMSELLIKRVVGLPGETIEIREGQLFVDGTLQDQPYARTAADANYGPTTLSPMTYFVMGDNRRNSNDSRSFGPIDRSEIIGRAWLRYWPINRLTVFQ